MPKIDKRKRCSLFPVLREDILTVQEVKQHPGWNITAFNLPSTWQHTRGEGVKIAVVDTGCDLDHPDLVGNLLPGKNFINVRKPPEDDNQHGTHVTGTICASDNSIGVVGVAPKAKVLPVKVLDKSGNGDLSIVADGIRWAVDQQVDFITMSLGSPNKVQEVRKAIQYAESKGVVVFVAAGNSGFTSEVFYPAAYPETIAIGSIDENFDRSKFSCTGKNLDFMAPGNKILSTVPKHWYAILSGTSMACPFAVGVAALLLSHNRKHNLNTWHHADGYRKAFKQWTTPIKNDQLQDKEFYEGFGIIDPRKLHEAFDAMD